MANLYTEDAKWMNPNAPSVVGKKALVSELSKLLNAGIASGKLNTVDVWGDENYVTEEGNYQLYAKDGTQIDKGKYLVLWKRVDGKLMFFRDMFSSDLPPAPVK
jgi:ketosteroid isomerase-like protein